MTMTADDMNVLRTARMSRVINKLKSVSVSNIAIASAMDLGFVDCCEYFTGFYH